MKLYLIKEVLEETSIEIAKKHEYPYVACVSSEEFHQNSDFFDMGIDLDYTLNEPKITKAEVNYDAVIGSFCIPDREDITQKQHSFSFALDEKGIAFINDDGYVQEKLERIIQLKKWRLPSLERFLFDFLEQTVDGDLRLLEQYESRLDVLEDRILAGEQDGILDEVVDIRSEIRDLKLNYGQLMDLAQELSENENEFFDVENLRYFDMYSNRVDSLLDITASLQEHSIQIRELLHAMLESKQNRLMAILTVVATIFMPLTLIVGWYGMNFVYMPELQYRYSYPVIILISISIVVGCIYFFKKNKWL